VKANVPVNIYLEDVDGEPKHMLYRDVLAERLGVTPKERLTMTILQDGSRVYVSVLLDGGDLTTAQERILRDFIQESGAMKVVGSLSQRPVTS
jgi:hypothetical protein